MSAQKIHILYNPFTYIAGVKSLIGALLAVVATAWVCFITGTHDDGLTNTRFAGDTIFIYFLLEHVLHWLFCAVMLFCAGIIFSKSSIRFIDVLGTTGLSRIPLFFLPVIRLIPVFRSLVYNSLNLSVLFVLHVVLVVWVVALTYHAYRVSCNVKQPMLVVSFAGALLLAEIISRLSLYFIVTL